MLIGNKVGKCLFSVSIHWCIDLEEYRQVPKETGEKFAKSFKNCMFFETSAKLQVQDWRSEFNTLQYIRSMLRKLLKL